MLMPGRPCRSSSTSAGRGPKRTRSPSAHQRSTPTRPACFSTARSATSLPWMSAMTPSFMHASLYICREPAMACDDGLPGRRWVRRVEGRGPFIERQQVAQLAATVARHDDFRVNVGWVYLADKFTAPSAGRQNVQLSVGITPHCHDLGDLIFARGHHGGDGSVLGAEAGTRGGVDADTRVAAARSRL